MSTKNEFTSNGKYEVEVVKTRDRTTGTFVSETRRMDDGIVHELSRDAESGVVFKEQWTRNGLLSRDGGPAVTLRERFSGVVSREEWHKDGRLQKTVDYSRLPESHLVPVSIGTKMPT